VTFDDDPLAPPLSYDEAYPQGHHGDGARVSNNGDEPAPPSDQPIVIITDLALHDLVETAYDVVVEANDPPHVYRRGMVLVRMTRDDEGRPFLRAMDHRALRLRLAEVADWRRRTPDGGTKPTHPPSVAASTLIAIADRLNRVPNADQIVTAPAFAHDGTLLLEAGYSPAARLIYEPAPGFTVPAVSPRPTNAEIVEARDLIVTELMGDFPFVGDAERAHAVALMLQPFVRPMIGGATPCYLLEAPTPGSGKGLLADVASLPALGSSLPAMAEGRDDDEWRKRLTSALLQGRPTIRIDNITRPLDSGALALALTEPVWQDRVLGVSRDVLLPIRCTWIVTGNNPSLTTEIARRSVRIRLDARVERPWLAGNDEGGRDITYRHADLRAWTLEHRDLLVWAALTLISAWLARSRPGVDTKLGSYEAWSDVLGGILATAGIDGFLDNLGDLYESSDSESIALAAFFADWWEEYGNRAVTASDLLHLGTRYLDLGGGSSADVRKRLGHRLAHLRNTVRGDLCVMPAGKNRAKIHTYRLEHR
jgi:putative DNA primase/helicase